MGIFDIFKRNRGHPAEKAGTASTLQIRAVTKPDGSPWCPIGYTPLSDVPEIKAGMRKIAELMSVMPLHLMRNTPNGNVRENNELSKKLDVNPCKRLTRPQWIYKIVMDMLLKGNSYGIPVYRERILANIIPVTMGGVIEPDGLGDYTVTINGIDYDPDEILHFVYNSDPDNPWNGRGLAPELRTVINALKQASVTSQAIMENPMPAVVIRVDNLLEDLSTPEGRKELSDRYIKSVDAGTPWMISAANFEVQQIKPLSLNDLAIKDDIEINKKTAAAILGVPPFVLGTGDFDKDAFNNFVSSRLQPIAVLIEQELTRKLLYSPDLFFKFSNRQLYSYTMEERLKFSTALMDRGVLSGNEVRIEFDMEPVEGLDERKVLENYIPVSMSGNQNKLNGGGE